MKKILNKTLMVLLACTFFFSILRAQSPEKMSYQAVIRNAGGKLIKNQSVGMQISILQGSAGGTAVYVETQAPTTNGNGQATIEIGGDAATIISGSFSAIDWTSGPYFIKTETDPEGGTSYSITGKSQLLSVPYALHAKTAETLSGTVPETDPVYSASQAANITETDITNLSNLSGTNTGDQDLSVLATKTALGDTTALIRSEIAVNTQAIQDTAAQIRADFPIVKTYAVGDFAQGGVVFWVDETGHHGLVCAIKDQDWGEGIEWRNGTFTDTEAHGDGIYAGKMNTVLVISNQGSNSNDYAAGRCANYSVTQNGITYGDWYLPSKEELDMMYKNRSTINAIATANGGSSFASEIYWSSTEYDNFFTWAQYFLSGVQESYYKEFNLRVRAVRAF